MRVVFVRGRRRGGNMERCRRADRTSLFTQSKTDAVLSRSVAGVTDLMVDAACAHSHQSDRECRPVLYPSIVHTWYLLYFGQRGIYAGCTSAETSGTYSGVCGFLLGSIIGIPFLYGYLPAIYSTCLLLSRLSIVLGIKNTEQARETQQ